MMLQDISEYKKCSKKFRSPTVEQLFSILHALVNLLVVVPDNLRQVITEGHLVCIFLIYFQFHFFSLIGVINKRYN
jgi:hypothetical protein